MTLATAVRLCNAHTGCNSAPHPLCCPLFPPHEPTLHLAGKAAASMIRGWTQSVRRDRRGEQDRKQHNMQQGSRERENKAEQPMQIRACPKMAVQQLPERASIHYHAWRYSNRGGQQDGWAGVSRTEERCCRCQLAKASKWALTKDRACAPLPSFPRSTARHAKAHPNPHPACPPMHMAMSSWNSSLAA